MALYQRLSASVTEQELLVRGVEESLAGGGREGTGEGSGGLVKEGEGGEEGGVFAAGEEGKVG